MAGASVGGMTMGGQALRGGKRVLSASTGPVLVVMTDPHMGNSVLSLPIVGRLAAYFDRPVDLLIDERYADLGELVPGLRRVLGYPSQASKRRGLMRNLGPAAMMLRTLGRYQAVFDFGGGTRQTTHTLSTLAPKRVGLADRNGWAYNRLVDPPPGLHAYEHYAHLLTAIGDRRCPAWTGDCLDDPVEAGQVVDAWLTQTFAPHSSHAPHAPHAPHTSHTPETSDPPQPLPAHPPLAIIHPSAGFAYRCWMPERFAAVADHLVRDRGMRVVIIGSPSEGELMDQVRHGMAQPEAARTAVFPMVQLLGLFKRSSLVVSNESGPTHLASLTDVPIVTIFGPTREDLWRPYRRERLMILRGAECDPRCGKRVCVIDQPCLRNTRVRDVIDAVNQVLEPPASQ